MDDEPIESSSSIHYEKSFARYRRRNYYKDLNKDKAFQFYSDQMAVIFKDTGRYDEWIVDFCKLTPESGEKGQKSFIDWSSTSHWRRFNAKKDSIDIDGEIFILTKERGPESHQVTLFYPTLQRQAMWGLDGPIPDQFTYYVRLN